METEVAVRAADGSSFTTSLPFSARRMWDAGGFLLLQAKETLNGTPTLFTMAHPLDEPPPLTARLPAPDGAQEFLLHSTLNVKLVCSGCEPPLAAAHGAVAPFLLLYDHALRHGAWHVEPRPAALGTLLDATGRQIGAADEGDAVKHVFSHAFGWAACGSVGGGGADVRRDWSPLDASYAATRAWADPDPATAEPAVAFLVSGHRTACPGRAWWY